MNSVCVIDGQHRIYAHYEAPITEKYESQIAPLRKQLHLLVTGLIFPPDMKPVERKQIQSQFQTWFRRSQRIGKRGIHHPYQRQ